jgi:Dolichyl-phosphate-mannose-protein mannosyltransferase
MSRTPCRRGLRSRRVEIELKALTRMQTTAIQEDQATPSAVFAVEVPDTGGYVPERSRSELYIALAIFSLSFLYLCILRRATWIDLDEGIILQGAQRILDGQVLYRDFFSFFTPGSYYLLALEFRIFGDSYLVAHTTLAFIGAVFSPITYLLARRVCSRQASLLVTGLMTLTTLPVRFVVLHNWDSTLWSCLAVYCAVRLLETPNTGWAFAAASFTSVTAVFEQSKGAGLLLGLMTGFVIITLGGQQRKLFTRGRLIATLLGFTWPFLVTLAYYASHHALTTMLADWFWPLQHYSASNRVPYAYGNMSKEALYSIFHTGSTPMRLVTRLVFSARSWIPYLPLLGVALLVRLTVPKWRNLAIGPDWSYYVLTSAAISGLLLSVVAARADYIHFMFLQPIFFLALAWLLDGRGIRDRFFIRMAPLFGFCFSVSLLAMAAQLLVFQASANTMVATRRGVIAMHAKDMLIDYIQSFTAPGEKILVYPYGSSYYYLTQTYSPTRYEFYQPGMHTDQQLHEMLAEFSAHPTRIVLFEPAFADHIPEAWPNTPVSALVRDPMADYIVREYRVCAMLDSATNWHFLFMVRKDLACPTAEKPLR